MSNDLEKIKELQEELAKLSEQLAKQQKTMARLNRQMALLSPQQAETPAPAPVPTPPVFRPGLQQLSLENIIGLRLIHLIGIIVLVIGLSLGVKYAIDKNFISEGMRISLTYLAGLIIYFFSFRLRRAYPGFSAILLSGAMASVYFTTYAAYVYYGMISFTVTFALMVCFTIFTAYEAFRYNRQEIAILGLVGAYGIPFLISPNKGDPALLFFYIAIINTGILVLSIKKAWTIMGRLAQAITWLIFIGWVVMQEVFTLKGTGLLFMCVFFFLFFFNAISPKLVRKESLTMVHATQLLLNNAAFSVAAFFIFGSAFQNSTIALISVSLSLFVMLQVVLFYVLKEGRTRNLLACYALALFILFIGFQWSGIMVTLLWLLTAVVLFILGVRRKSNPLRMTAITLMGITLLKLVALDSLTFSTIQKVIAYLVLGVLLLLVSFFYQKFRHQLFEE